MTGFAGWLETAQAWQIGLALLIAMFVASAFG